MDADRALAEGAGTKPLQFCVPLDALSDGAVAVLVDMHRRGMELRCSPVDGTICKVEVAALGADLSVRLARQLPELARCAREWCCG